MENMRLNIKNSNISPDLIYLDGPSINSVKNKKFENFRFDRFVEFQ